MSQTQQGTGRPHQEFLLRQFNGVNQKASRVAIPDGSFYWLENMIPIGDANLQSVSGLGDAIATVAGPSGSPYNSQGFNVNGTNFVFAIFTNGSMYSVNLSTNAVTNVATAGTFSSSGAVMAQWNNTDIVIADPNNGYFVYDGTTLYTNGQAISAAVTNGGNGYTAATVAFFLSGGATATAAVASGVITGYAVLNSGQGYTSAPVVVIVDPVGTGATATAVVSGGGVISITVGAGGTGYVRPTILLIGGGGLPGVVPTGTATTGSGLVTGITLLTEGSGMLFPPIAVISGTGKGALASVRLVAGPSNGTSVAVYASRVWVGYRRSVTFSDVNSNNSFAVTGGTFTISDSTLSNYINQLYTANNYLYILGDSNIDILYNVNVSGTPATTTFTRTNLNNSVGSSLPFSVFSYYNGLMFANQTGFYSLLGSSPNKTSSDLDQIVQAIDFSKPVVGGQVNVNGVLCAAFSFNFLDRFTTIGGNRRMLALNFNGKWYFSSQSVGSVPVQFEVFIETNSTPLAYGWVNTTLYPMFSDGSPSAIYVETKLYDGGSDTTDKRILKLGAGLTWSSSGMQSISINMQNEKGLVSQGFVDDNGLTFYGAAPISFVGSGEIDFTSGGYSFYKTDIQYNGFKYFGFKITSASVNLTINSINVQWVPGPSW